MHLRTQIYKSNLPKTFVLSVVLGLFFFYSNTLFADNHSACHSASPAKKNRKKANQFDTLFCAQKPIAKIMTVNAVNDSFATYYYYHINDTSLFLSVKPIRYFKANTNQAQVYYHFEFPNIQMNADYKPKTQAKNVKEIVCEYELINKDGLDTLKSELFATIHGNMQDQNTKKVDAEKLFIVERNKASEIKIEDLEISQDGIFLGRCEEEELDGPNGKIIQYSIFNSTGALVCTASKMPQSNGNKMVQWNLLTQRDMRFSAVQLKSDNFVIELLKYLVANSII
jgi:hypothetical protein